VNGHHQTEKKINAEFWDIYQQYVF